MVEVSVKVNVNDLAGLNDYLLDKSFILGSAKATAADAVLFQALKSEPSADKFANAARWYRFIASVAEGERKKWADTTGQITIVQGAAASSSSAAPAKAAKAAKADDDIDLFGDDDDEEAAAEMAKLKASKEAEKKDKKPAVVGKTSVVLEVKPWESDTNLDEMEEKIRGINIDGLTWGASKKADVAFGIKKLVIMCTVVDDKVPSMEDITDPIQAFEDYVQSVDIAAMNKI